MSPVKKYPKREAPGGKDRPHGSRHRSDTTNTPLLPPENLRSEGQVPEATFLHPQPIPDHPNRSRIRPLHRSRNPFGGNRAEHPRLPSPNRKQKKKKMKKMVMMMVMVNRKRRQRR